MKEQAARAINTYQTFNCTISEQYVCMSMHKHCQLEMNRDDIHFGMAPSTLLTHSHSY